MQHSTTRLETDVWDLTQLELLLPQTYSPARNH